MSKTKLSFLIILTFLLIFAPLTVVFYLKNKAQSPVEILKKIATTSPGGYTPVTDNLESNGKVLEFFQKNASINNQADYISKTKEMLQDPSLSSQEKAELNFKLASVQSVVRASPDMAKNRIESLNYFDTLIQSTSTNKFMIKMRDYAILNSVHSLYQCCKSRQEFEGETTYARTYRSYLQKTNNVDLSQRLALNDMIDSTSSNSKNDPSIRGLRILIKATILDYFGSNISKDSFEKLKDELNVLLSTPPASESALMTDLANAVYEPKLYEAYGKDVLKRVTSMKLSSQDNKEIDGYYISVDKSLDVFLRQQSDKPSYFLMKMYNLSRYIRSMSLRGYSEDSIEVDSVIDALITIINSSPEARGIVGQVKDNNAYTSQIYFFFKVAQKNEKLATYFKSINLMQ